MDDAEKQGVRTDAGIACRDGRLFFHKINRTQEDMRKGPGWPAFYTYFNRVRKGCAVRSEPNTFALVVCRKYISTIIIKPLECFLLSRKVEEPQLTTDLLIHRSIHRSIEPSVEWLLSTLFQHTHTNRTRLAEWLRSKLSIDAQMTNKPKEWN